MKHQRDELINCIFESAKNDNNIYFLSADFGAPALDKFRTELPKQFIHCGISEQHMIDMAVGLSLDGNKVFCYAMAPFVTLRCLEQHKCGASIMNLPIVTIVAGVGFGYADAGPTHYATEDLACLRSMIGASVYTASDASISKEIAKHLLQEPKFSFIRLDRNPSIDFEPFFIDKSIPEGFRIYGNKLNELCIITSGYMYGKTLSFLKEKGLNDKCFLIDLIRVKPFPDIEHVISKAKNVLIVDEQTSYGSLSSAFLEYMCDANFTKNVHRMFVPDKHFFDNGGRETIHSLAGISNKHIENKILKILNF